MSLTVILFLQVVCTGRLTAYAKNSAKDARNSVVRIMVENYYRGSLVYTSAGTGICVGEKSFRHVITNRHVVEADLSDPEIVEFCYSKLSDEERSNTSTLAFIIQLQADELDSRVYVLADNYAYEVDG